MKITYLGHAGFLLETAKTILIMDAWLSAEGAFDGGWFQYPSNHHLLDSVTEKLRKNGGGKQVFIYVSHEHKDHFDLKTLTKLDKFELTYIIPKFRRPVLFDQIKSFTKNPIILCRDEQLLTLGEDDSIKIYIEDSELNRDSAILFSNGVHKFLNLNDCKIHDRLAKIKNEEKEIAIFAAQFSGATWHPTCYDYTEAEYERISVKKKLSKFESTALAIELIAPKMYIPSAGPACFLDPDLIHINFQKENIFPRNEEFIDFLKSRLKTPDIALPNLMPGEVTVVDKNIKSVDPEIKNIAPEDFKSYILAYSERYKNFFDTIKKPVQGQEFKQLEEEFIQVFKRKLANFKSKNQIERPLYVRFNDHSAHFIKISFQYDQVSLAQKITEENFYMIEVNSYDIKRVLGGYLTWEDYSLTFRMKLNREPDVYQVLMQGFFILEEEDLNHFCDSLLEIERRNERIVVEVGGCRYSVDRYCPHQGADLKVAWSENGKYLVCPRHRWAFDLENGGQCVDNSGSIHAIPLEND